VIYLSLTPPPKHLARKWSTGATSEVNLVWLSNAMRLVALAQTMTSLGRAVLASQSSTHSFSRISMVWTSVLGRLRSTMLEPSRCLCFVQRRNIFHCHLFLFPFLICRPLVWSIPLRSLLNSIFTFYCTYFSVPFLFPLLRPRH
jgi:hypothetical protein